MTRCEEVEEVEARRLISTGLRGTVERSGIDDMVSRRRNGEQQPFSEGAGESGCYRVGRRGGIDDNKVKLPGE